MKTKIRFIILVCISIAIKASAQEKSAASNKEKAVYSIVEEMPQYPGGDDARINFIVKNIKYPEAARNSNIQGTVYVSFVIDTLGKVTNAKIIRGIGGGCEEEVLRLVNSMPNWIPGKQKGVPVNVLFNMPIKFKLDDDDKSKDSQKK